MILEKKKREAYRTPQVECIALDSPGSLCEVSPVPGQDMPFADDEF